MRRFFDPDRRILSRDKLFHAVGGFLTFVFLNFFTTWGWALVLTVLAGAIFELGQWDASRGTALEGQAGYGFGVLDLGADTLGAIFAVILLASACSAVPPKGHPSVPRPKNPPYRVTTVQAQR